jgi:hypothetical protein
MQDFNARLFSEKGCLIIIFLFERILALSGFIKSDSEIKKKIGFSKNIKTFLV